MSDVEKLKRLIDAYVNSADSWFQPLVRILAEHNHRIEAIEKRLDEPQPTDEKVDQPGQK